MVGFLVAPHVFAETNVDYETTLFTDPKGKYSIEFPSDKWQVQIYPGQTNVKIMIRDQMSETVMMLSHYVYQKNPRVDWTDQEILQSIHRSHIDMCNLESFDVPFAFSYHGCSKFEAVDKKIAYTNQGEKLWMVDMTFTNYLDKYYFIETDICNGCNDTWTITARTTVKDSKQAWKFDTENLQKIRETMKSFTILKPDTTPEPTELSNVQKIPDWVRNIFIWYGEEQISETELLGAIQFLVQQGIIDLE